MTNLVKLTTDVKEILFGQHTGLLGMVDQAGKPEILVRVVELWDEETFIIPEKNEQVLQTLEANPFVCICTSSTRSINAEFKFNGKANIHRDDSVIKLYKELQKKPPHSIYRLLAVLTVECDEIFWKQKDGSWLLLGVSHAQNCYKCAKERGKVVLGEGICALCGGIICKFHRLGEEPVCISCARRFGINNGWKREIAKRKRAMESPVTPR